MLQAHDMAAIQQARAAAPDLAGLALLPPLLPRAQALGMVGHGTRGGGACCGWPLSLLRLSHEGDVLVSPLQYRCSTEGFAATSSSSATASADATASMHPAARSAMASASTAPAAAAQLTVQCVAPSCVPPPAAGAAPAMAATAVGEPSAASAAVSAGTNNNSAGAAVHGLAPHARALICWPDLDTARAAMPEWWKQ